MWQKEDHRCGLGGLTIWRRVSVIVHSFSSGKIEMFLCAACHAFTPHLDVWKC